MRRFVRPIAAAALTAAGLLSAPAVNAQAQPPLPSQSDQAPSIPEQKLDAAAAAMTQVASLRKQYQQRIEEAPASDKERIAGEGSSALVKAVTDQGLSIDEYSTILQVAQNDKAVRDKLLQRLRPED
jgi:hypothetical protein